MFWTIIIAVTIILSAGTGFFIGGYWRKRQKVSRTQIPSVLTEWDLECMAYHEAGHAVCSIFLPETEPIIRITIDPDDDAFGYVVNSPRKHHNATEVYFKSKITTYLAGKMAEQIFLGITTTSCIHDLRAASEIADLLVGKYGMGQRIGNLSLDDVPISLQNAFYADVKEIISDSTNQAKEILTQHRDLMIQLSNLLLRKRTLDEITIKNFLYRMQEIE